MSLTTGGTMWSELDRSNSSLTWDNSTLNSTTSAPQNTASSNNYSQMLNILHFQYYAWGVTGNVISALGILGNLLSIVVLANRRMRSSTSVFLIAQAVFDIFVLVAFMLCMALPIINYYTQHLDGYARFYPYFQPIAYPFALTAQTCSIYTTVGFTVERFIAVCYPLKAARWCTPQKARRAILLIVLISVVYNIPRMLEYKTEEYIDRYNRTQARFVVTHLGNNKTFQHVYFIYMHMTVMLLVPFALLSFMNAMLIRAVRQSQRTKGKVNQKQHKDNNLTVMLIAVVMVFLICQVPSIVDNIFMATLAEDTIKTPPFIRLTCIASLMVIANSAANFYLYCVFGHKFRKVFCHLFCCCMRHRFAKTLLEHETSLLRGSSFMKDRDGSYKHCLVSSKRKTQSARCHSNEQNSMYSTPRPMVYRYSKAPGKSMKVTMGNKALIKAPCNGQTKYTSINCNDHSETHV